MPVTVSDGEIAQKVHRFYDLENEVHACYKSRFGLKIAAQLNIAALSAFTYVGGFFAAIGSIAICCAFAMPVACTVLAAVISLTVCVASCIFSNYMSTVNPDKMDQYRKIYPEYKKLLWELKWVDKEAIKKQIDK